MCAHLLSVLCGRNYALNIVLLWNYNHDLLVDCLASFGLTCAMEAFASNLFQRLYVQVHV
jgi:hypothetical protein